MISRITGRVLTMHPGDTVLSSAGEEHWHGALDRFMTHLARLFLFARAVEWHLRKIFTKLDTGSRRELRGPLPALGQPDRGPSDRRSGRRRCAGSRR